MRDISVTARREYIHSRPFSTLFGTRHALIVIDTPTWFNIYRIDALRATSSFRNLQCKADKIKFPIFYLHTIRVNKSRREI